MNKLVSLLEKKDVVVVGKRKCRLRINAARVRRHTRDVVNCTS